MNYYTEISEKAKVLNHSHGIMLAAMCAASVEPVITQLGSTVTKAVSHETIQELWDTSLNPASGLGVLSRRKQLADLPEANCDDSNLPAYEVMKALGVMFYASDMNKKDDKYARDACSQAAECYSGFDYVIQYGNRSVRIDPREPTEIGRLKQHLIDAQFHFIHLAVSGENSDDRLLHIAKELAESLSSELSSALPEFLRKRGWLFA